MSGDALRQVRCPTCNRWVAEIEGVRLRVICKCGVTVTVLARDAGEVVIVAIEKRRWHG